MPTTTLAGIGWNPCLPSNGITVRLQSESRSAIIGIRTDAEAWNGRTGKADLLPPAPHQPETQKF
jgi:hypothetical protein